MMRLFNTLTRQKEEFKPILGDEAKIYSCGPTVYDYAHIGNLRAYIFADTLKRTLLYNKYQVRHIMNITDVGHLTGDRDMGRDKMELSAQEQDKTAWEIASYYTDAFLSDIKELNIILPDKLPKATDHIKEMITLIEVLEKKDFTYKTSDGIYFDTSKLKDYGKLALLAIEGLKEGARVEINPGKKNPTDFALWKLSVPKGTHPELVEGSKRQMEWKSPWGIGFPGWHIECSAMSTKYLGQPFDIHTGGIDHIPVHHTNEIAQSEAAYGKPLANFWLHSEFVMIDEGRMGKSEGNLITLQELKNGAPRLKPWYLLPAFAKAAAGLSASDLARNPPKPDDVLPSRASSVPPFIHGQARGFRAEADKGCSPLAYRYFVLGAHYRSKLNFTFASIEGAQNALNNLYSTISEYQEPKIGCAEFEHQFLEAINDDLDTPKALAIVWDMVRSDYPSEAKLESLFEFDKILGLSLKETWQELQRPLPDHIQKLIHKREQERQNNNWEKADELRKEIETAGFEIKDTDKGPLVKRKI